MTSTVERPAVPAVGIVGITKRFDDVVAVDDVSFDIGDGEFFSMLGPSGCGKTTMLRMIAGLEFPSAGRVMIFGDEVEDVPPNKRPVNTVFQHYALFPHLDVGANVEFGMRMQKVGRAERRRRAADALSLVRLDGMERRTPAQLSGGQQQRVALARALVNRPKVLLLDEPLGALDLKLRQEMQHELMSLQRELGITFVFVTHDQEEALTMSDRIAVMNAGTVLQIGSPDEIYERPTDRFVADFIGRTNLLDATVAADGTVALATGARLAAETGARAAGTPVCLALRPERAAITPLGDATPAGGIVRPTDGRSLGGVVTGTTYLGSSVVYQVTVEWMRLDVRADSLPTARIEVGTDVLVSWDAGALVVLGDATDAPDGGPDGDPDGADG